MYSKVKQNLLHVRCSIDLNKISISITETFNVEKEYTFFL